MACLVCGCGVYARERCRTCYRYLRRHKVDRTEEMVVAAAQRRFEREEHKALCLRMSGTATA